MNYSHIIGEAPMDMMNPFVMVFVVVGVNDHG